VVRERQGQHPAERPQNAAGLRCGVEQGDGLRVVQQRLHLPGECGGARHDAKQPPGAFRQAGIPPLLPGGGRAARPGRRRLPGLNPGDERREPRRQAVQPGENPDQQRPGEAVDSDARRGSAG
jgi:hypothetical protein